MAPINNSTMEDTTIVMSSDVNGTNTNGTSAIEIEKWLEENMWFLIGGCAGAVGLVLICCCCIVCWCRVKAHHLANRGQDAARAIIKGSTDLTAKQIAAKQPMYIYQLMTTSTHPTRTETKDFEAEATKLDRLNEKEAATYAQGVRYKKPKAPAGVVDLQRLYDQEVFTISHARYPSIPLMDFSQAPVMGIHLTSEDHMALHANILPDLYDNEVIISQAPLRNSFGLFLEMLWQRNVGIVVWLGPTGGGKHSMIDPYFEVETKINEELSRFHSNLMKEDIYVRYYTKKSFSFRNHVVHAVDDKLRENRELFLFHIDPWPKRRKDRPIADVALLVEMVRSLQLQQEKKDLPGILIHCSTGLELSATFFAMYVSRQMQIRFNVVNVQAVLRLIDRTRYQSFSTEKAFDHIQLVYAVVLEFIQKYPPPQFKDVKKPEKFPNTDKALVTYAPRKPATVKDKKMPSFLNPVVPKSRSKGGRSATESGKSNVRTAKSGFSGRSSAIETQKSVIGNRSKSPSVPIGPGSLMR